jgi:pilus assembly protein CpaF
MRPDRIIVGGCGPEAFDMLQAMNTGHDGSMSTVHASHLATRSIALKTW